MRFAILVWAIIVFALWVTANPDKSSRMILSTGFETHAADRSKETAVLVWMDGSPKGCWVREDARTPLTFKCGSK